MFTCPLFWQIMTAQIAMRPVYCVALSSFRRCRNPAFMSGAPENNRKMSSSKILASGSCIIVSRVLHLYFVVYLTPFWRHMLTTKQLG